MGNKRSFFDDKLDAVFTLSDMFNGYGEQGTSQSNITNYNYNDKPDSRRVGLTLRYHFGGNLVKEKTTKTDEQKCL